MSSRAWFPLYPGDYLADTMHFREKHHGIFFMALMHQWQHGHLPANIEDVMFICRTADRPATEMVLGYFSLDDNGRWYHPRLEKERIRAEENAGRARINGRRGGRPKGSKKTQRVSSGLAEKNPDHNPDVTQTITQKKATTTTTTKVTKNPMSDKSDDLSTIIDYLNDKAGTHYRHVQTNTDLIAARLKEGYTLEDMRSVIDDKCRQWLDSPQAQYLRPSTLFRREKFSQYVGQIGVQTHETTQPASRRSKAEVNHEYLQRLTADLDAEAVCQAAGQVHHEVGRDVSDAGSDGGGDVGVVGTIIDIDARRH